MYNDFYIVFPSNEGEPCKDNSVDDSEDLNQISCCNCVEMNLYIYFLKDIYIL